MVAWVRDAENLSPSVLITDDNDGWRAIVEDILSRVGFHTLEATCGEEAIELVRTEHLDVVLMDFHMPRLDGIETLRIIRRNREHLPAVLMTGHPQDVPAAEVQALRVETVLTKTADRQHIVTTVTKIVRWP
jgi:CheY-like chemotaxis protein